MSSILTNYFGNQLLNWYFDSNNTWLGLHDGDPGVNGDISTEISHGGYERQPINFTNNPSNKTVASTNQQIFTNLGQSTITHLAVWDAVSNGNCLIRLALGTSITVNAGGQFAATAGDIAFTL